MGKVTALTAITEYSDGDLLYAVDDPAGTPVSKKITVEDVIRQPHGEIYVNSGAGSQTLTTSTWNKITQFTVNGDSWEATPDHTNDKITVARIGHYMVGLQISFSGASNATFTIAVYWNGSITTARCKRKLGTGGDVGSASVLGLVNATIASTDFEIYVFPDGNHNFVVEEANFFVHRVE